MVAKVESDFHDYAWVQSGRGSIIERSYYRPPSFPRAAALKRWMQRLIGGTQDDEYESVSLISSPVRSSAATTAANRRFGSFGMERRRNRNPFDEEEDSASVEMTSDGVAFAGLSGGGGGTSSGRGEDEELQADPTPNMSGKYEDFHTIDWQRDLARDRYRHKQIAGRVRDFPLGLFEAAWDAGAGWICVLLVGIAAGATAGVIDIAARWMSDLKDGICADRFWLDREHCCWSSNDTISKDGDCSAWTTWPEMFNDYTKSPLYYIIELFFYVSWAVGMSTLAVFLVKVFAPYACGSGIPEIKCILSGFIIRGYLGKWTFLIKSVGLILASASGLSLGKEGPMVHLACCIGNIFSYLFPKYGKNEAKKREILSASAAAGVSVAFGAPIGGVMFSLEEASYFFPLKTMWRSFFCALVAGIVLRVVNPFGSDQTSLFHVDYMMKWSFIELIPFGLLGVFGGLLGSLFTYLNIKWCRFRKESRTLGGNPIYEVMLLTFFTAAISYFNPFLRKSGTALIKQLFDRCGPEGSTMCAFQKMGDAPGKDLNGYFGDGVRSAVWQLLVAFIFKFIFTIFTFGIKIPCGLFVPSMVLGSIAGRLLGIMMEGLTRYMQEGGAHNVFSCQIGKDCMMPGLYAMVGAAAVLGGMTRMTVSLVVIMFELTGSLEFIVPTMVATMFAKWIGDATHKQGMYEAHIELNGYPFLENKGEYPYSTLACQVMRPSSDRADAKEDLAVVVQDSMTLGETEQLLRDTNYNGFPVVISKDTMYLIGFVSRRDLQLALHSARKTQPNVVTASTVFYTSNVPEFAPGHPAPLRLRRIIDLAPMTVTDQTPMETVIDMFRKLGLRQVLVTRSGKVLGVITKKDILHFMRKGDADDEGVINPNFK